MGGVGGPYQLPQARQHVWGVRHEICRADPYAGGRKFWENFGGFGQTWVRGRVLLGIGEDKGR